MLLQITDICGSHWAAIQMVKDNRVHLYDYTNRRVTLDTVDKIFKFGHCVKSSITIHVLNTSKQAGCAVDCALFAMAPVSSLALARELPVLPLGSCL